MRSVTMLTPRGSRCPNHGRVVGRPRGSYRRVRGRRGASATALSETPRPDGGYPLSTHVEAYFLGDMTAIAAAAIRSEGLLKR